MPGLLIKRDAEWGCGLHSAMGFVLGAASLLGPKPVWAEAARAVEVETRRVALGQILTECRGRVCGVDLGPAPPPGGRRTIARARVLEAVRKSGLVVSAARVPRLIRVTGAAQRLSPAELEKWARPSVVAALPPGAELKRLEVASAQTLPKRATLTARVGKAPRRSGRQVRSVSLDVAHEGVVVRRILALAHLEVSASAVQPAVRRGQSIELRIERPYAVVGAQAHALRDLWVGQVGAFKVSRTGKVLLGRVRSASHVEVVQSQ